MPHLNGRDDARDIAALSGLTRATTARLLNEALTDLESANRRIARLIHAMQSVEDAILADPNADVVTKSLATVLRDARESK